MFKIDKSSVEYIDSNKSFFVIKQWTQQDDTENDIVEEELQEEEIEYSEEADSSEADEIILAARQQAELIVAEAYRQAGEIKNSAWQEGYAQGTKEAKAQMEKLHSEDAEKLRKAFQEFKEIQNCIYQELEDNILQLSLDIAEKIVNIQLEKDDIVFIGMVKKAIAALNAKGKFSVHLNQKEFEHFFSNGSEWLAEELQCSPFAVVRDSAVNPGGCVLDSDEGILKAGVETQLKMISIALGQDERQYNEAH